MISTGRQTCKVRAEPQRSQCAKRLASDVVMALVTLCGTAWAVDITTDTRIDEANVDEYASEPTGRLFVV